MTRNPIDYSKSVFYKIVCKDLTITDLYVGHTTDFKARKTYHKTSCINERSKVSSFRVYQFIKANGGWDNWEMVLIEKRSCEDSLEAHTIERHYVETLNAMLNCNVPSRTKEEWGEANKDKRREYKKIYNEKNKEILKEKRIQDKDKLREYKKIYNEKNKEKLRERNALRYINNKDYHTEYNRLHKEAKKIYNKTYTDTHKKNSNQVII